MDADKRERAIFTIEDDAFGWEEIVLAADVWGE